MLRPKKTEYTTLKGRKCGCRNCTKPAFSQMYICALNGFVLLCADHDNMINFKAILTVTDYDHKEVGKWMKKYTAHQDDSPPRKFVSPEKSTSEK